LTDSVEIQSKQESSDGGSKWSRVLGSAVLGSARWVGKVIGYAKKQVAAGKQTVDKLSEKTDGGGSVIEPMKKAFDSFLEGVDKHTASFAHQWKEGFQEGVTAFKTGSDRDARIQAENLETIQEAKLSAREGELIGQVRGLQEQLDDLMAEHERMEEEIVSDTDETADTGKIEALEMHIKALTQERKQLQEELASTKDTIKRIKAAHSRFHENGPE